MFSIGRHIAQARMSTNRSGGRSFVVDPWRQLERALILGTEGGSYYVSESGLTRQAMALIDRLLDEDGARVVRVAVEISEAGRAPKNDYAIYVVARASVRGDDATRKAANDAMPKVCRTGTHLFQWASMVKQMASFSYGRRRAVRDWYTGRSAADLAYQAIKYRQRKVDGHSWTHRDLLRLARPRIQDASRRLVVDWMVHGVDGEVGDKSPEDASLERIWAFERLQVCEDLEEARGLIEAHKLPRECVDGKWFQGQRARGIWAALLGSMPYTATLRNLGNMSKAGLLVKGGEATRAVVARLTDEDYIRRSRVHPFALLTAHLTYKSGGGLRGSGAWTPVASVVDALDRAFYMSFGNVPETGKRWLIALDVSGSMASLGWGGASGLMNVPGLSPRIASAAMSMIFAHTQASHRFMAFSSGFVPLSLGRRDRLDQVVRKVSGLPFDSTDCSRPMTWAREVWKREKQGFDAFVVFTDNDTNCNKIAPHEALRRYRQHTGIDAKLIVMAMTADRFTIADPDDAGMLDMAGLDAAGPRLITDFVGGAF